VGLCFRAEFFNTFNHPNFGNPIFRSQPRTYSATLGSEKHYPRGAPRSSQRRYSQSDVPSLSEKPYWQRTNVETIFSAVKRKLSSRAPGRSVATQVRQALLLGLAYNLYRLRHRTAHRGCQQSLSVPSKELTEYLSPVDATLTKNPGEGCRLWLTWSPACKTGRANLFKPGKLCGINESSRRTPGPSPRDRNAALHRA
jgi:hypothetical protein